MMLAIEVILDYPILALNAGDGTALPGTALQF
jgi:hypothetical protein